MERVARAILLQRQAALLRDGNLKSCRRGFRRQVGQYVGTEAPWLAEWFVPWYRRFMNTWFMRYINLDSSVCPKQWTLIMESRFYYTFVGFHWVYNVFFMGCGYLMGRELYEGNGLRGCARVVADTWHKCQNTYMLRSKPDTKSAIGQTHNDIFKYLKVESINTLISPITGGFCIFMVCLMYRMLRLTSVIRIYQVVVQNVSRPHLYQGIYLNHLAMRRAYTFKQEHVHVVARHNYTRSTATVSKWMGALNKELYFVTLRSFILGNVRLGSRHALVYPDYFVTLEHYQWMLNKQFARARPPPPLGDAVDTMFGGIRTDKYRRG